MVLCRLQEIFELIGGMKIVTKMNKRMKLNRFEKNWNTSIYSQSGVANNTFQSLVAEEVYGRYEWSVQ